MNRFNQETYGNQTKTGSADLVVTDVLNYVNKEEMSMTDLI